MRGWDQGECVQVTTVLAFLFSLLVQVGVPLTAALAFRRRTLVRWNPFIAGAIVFSLFQLFTWLPVSTWLDSAVGSELPSGLPAFLWLLTMAFAGTLLEESGRLWGFQVLFRRSGEGLDWQNGVMYGLGHGGVESMLLIAGLTFLYLLAYVAVSLIGVDAIVASLGGTPSAAFSEALQGIADTTWTQPLVVAFERVLGLVHQVAWSLLVMESLVTRQKRWFAYAVLYHGSVAVIVPGLARLVGVPLAESVNGMLAVLSVWVIHALRVMSNPE